MSTNTSITRTSAPPFTPSKPLAHQSRSPLLRLPAEIRLHILRELLVSKNPIKANVVIAKHENHPEYQELQIGTILQNHKRNRYGAPGAEDGEVDEKGRELKKRNNYRIHTDVLLTCQLILKEGWELMYAENILTIHIARHWFCNRCVDDNHDAQMCTIISAFNDACLLQHDHHSGSYCVLDYIPRSYLASKPALSDVELNKLEQNMYESVQRLNANARDFAKRFRTFEILIIDSGRQDISIAEGWPSHNISPLHDRENFAEYIQQLSRILNHQSVTLVIDIPVLDQHPNWKYKTLNLLKLLRCSAFSIEGMPETTIANETWTSSVVPVLEGIQQVVTSNSKIVDLPQKLKAFKAELSITRARFVHLDEAAYTFDVAGFTDQCKKITRIFDWNYLRLRRQQAKDFVNRRRRALSTMDSLDGGLAVDGPNDLTKEEASLFER